MSNYDPVDADDGSRQIPRDTSKEPEVPVKDVHGQSATFGDEDPFEGLTEEEVVLAEFQISVSDKFKSIWKNTFK